MTRCADTGNAREEMKRAEGLIRGDLSPEDYLSGRSMNSRTRANGVLLSYKGEGNILIIINGYAPKEKVKTSISQVMTCKRHILATSCFITVNSD